MLRDIFVFQVLPFLTDDLEAIWSTFRVNRDWQSFLSRAWSTHWTEAIRSEMDDDEFTGTSVRSCMEWTKLYVHRGCAQCTTARIRKVTRAYGVRWCIDCLKQGGISEYVLNKELSVPTTSFTDLPFIHVSLWSRYKGTYEIRCFFFAHLKRRLAGQYPLLDQRIQHVEEVLESRRASVRRIQRADTWKKELKRTREETWNTSVWSFLSCFESFDEESSSRMEPQQKRARLEQLSRDYDELLSVHDDMLEQERKNTIEREKTRQEQMEQTRLAQQERDKQYAAERQQKQSMTKEAKNHEKKMREEENAAWSKRLLVEQTNNRSLQKTTCPFCAKPNLKGMVDHCRTKHRDLLIRENN